MQTEETLVKLIFENQMVFCGIFGAVGGVVHNLDLRTEITVFSLLSKIFISFSTGLLLFFSTYDLDVFTPSIRIAAAIVAGFYGSALFRYLAKFYLKQLPVGGLSPMSNTEKKSSRNKKQPAPENSCDDEDR